MSKLGAVLLVGLMLVAVPCTLALANPHTFTFGLLDSNHNPYQVTKVYYKYWNETNCYTGPFCIKTSKNNKLGHYHFTQDFNATERGDADHLVQHAATYDLKYQSATTDFNCHAYALCSRGDIWVTSQSIKLADDYRLVAGTCTDPYHVDDRCNHSGQHSSIIVSIAHAWGWGAANAADRVKGKWGGYGKYKSVDTGGGYPDPSGIYR